MNLGAQEINGNRNQKGAELMGQDLPPHFPAASCVLFLTAFTIDSFRVVSKLPTNLSMRLEQRKNFLQCRSPLLAVRCLSGFSYAEKRESSVLGTNPFSLLYIVSLPFCFAKKDVE